MKKALSLFLLTVMCLTATVSCNGKSVAPPKNNANSKVVGENVLISDFSDKNYDIKRIELPNNLSQITDIDFKDGKTNILCYHEEFDSNIYIQKYNYYGDSIETIPILQQIETEHIFVRDSDICEDYYFFITSSDKKDQNGKYVTDYILEKFNTDSAKEEKYIFSDSHEWKELSVCENTKIVYCVDRNFNIDIYDFDLTLISNTNISSELLSKHNIQYNNYEIKNSATDINGHLYILIYNNDTMEYHVIKLTDEYKIDYIIDDFNDLGEIIEISSLKNGKIAIYSSDANYTYVNIINEKNGDVKERHELKRQEYGCIFGYDYDTDLVKLSSCTIDTYLLDGETKKDSFICDEPPITFDAGNYRIDDGIEYSVHGPQTLSCDAIYSLDANENISCKHKFYSGSESIYSDRSGNIFYSVNGNITMRNADDADITITQNNTMSRPLKVMGANKNILTCSDINKYCVYDVNGKLISEFTLHSSAKYLQIADTDEKCYVYYHDATKDKIYYFDVQKNKSYSADVFNNAFEIADDFRMYSGGIYDINIINDGTLYGYNVNDNTITMVVRDIHSYGISNIFKIISTGENGNLICITSQSENDLFILSPSDIEKQNDVLTMAIVNSQAPTKEITLYNSQNFDTKIRCFNYDHLSDLNIDIVSGNIPDIILSLNYS